MEDVGTLAYVFASPEPAAKDRPELTIEIDAIEALHQDMVARRPTCCI